MGANGSKDNKTDPQNTSDTNKPTGMNLDPFENGKISNSTKQPQHSLQLVNIADLKKKGYTKEQILNAILEHILQFSSQAGPQSQPTYKPLKQDNLTTFTVGNFDDVVQHILESEPGCYFTRSEDKVKYIYSTFIRAVNFNPNSIFTEDVKSEVLQVLLSYFVSLLISPEVFDSSFKCEDDQDLFDLSSQVNTAFYELLKGEISESFLKVLFTEINEEDYPAIITPIFKRMLKDTRTCTLENVKQTLKALSVLTTLFKADRRLIRFFYNHPVFLPERVVNGNPTTGSSFQQTTILGCALALSSLPEENNTYISFFAEIGTLSQAKKTVDLLRERIHGIVETVHDILEFIIINDNRGKFKVAEWFYRIIEMNNDKQKMYSTGSSFSSEGFLLNFLSLLLQFCKSFLDDFEKIPQRLEKIDVMYLRERKIFDHLSLLNGNSNFYFPQHCVSESKPVPEKIKGDTNPEEEISSDDDENSKESKGQLKEQTSEDDQGEYEEKEFDEDHQADNEDEEEKQIEQSCLKESYTKVVSNNQKSDTNYLASPLKKPTMEKTSFTLLTELIFLTNHTLRLVLTQFQAYKKFTCRMENEKGSISGLLTPHFIKKMSKKYAYDIQYGNPQLWELLLRLLMVDGLYITYNHKHPISSLKVPDNVFDSLISTNNIKVSDANNRLAEKETEISDRVGIPSDMKSEEKVGMVPSYWAENIFQYSEIMLECREATLGAQAKCSKILTNFMLVALGSSGWVTNPHLKADYLDFLNNLLIKEEKILGEKKNNSDSYLFASILEDNFFIEKNLVNELISYYWQLGKMNTVHEMEKYSYRHRICQLMNRFTARKDKFPDSMVKSAIITLTKDSNSFPKFSSSLLQDITTLLDESLQKIRTCIEQQDLLANTNDLEMLLLGFSNRPEQDINIQQNKQTIKVSIKFLNSFSETLYLLTKLNNEAFDSEEMMEKLAHGLNYCVHQLLTKKTNPISLAKMRHLRFDPAELLKFICLLISNFKENERMLKTMIRDERSYDLKLYQEAILLLMHENRITDDELYNLQVVVEKLKLYIKEKEADDLFMSQIGEIPEEFVDPIMSSVMKDPVLLPTSGMVVDRTTILKHFLVDLTDPFNRKPLTKEMLQPQDQLKDQINNFFDEKLKAYKSKL